MNVILTKAATSTMLSTKPGLDGELLNKELTSLSWESWGLWGHRYNILISLHHLPNSWQRKFLFLQVMVCCGHMLALLFPVTINRIFLLLSNGTGWFIWSDDDSSTSRNCCGGFWVLIEDILAGYFFSKCINIKNVSQNDISWILIIMDLLYSHK